jgi:oligoribonuclease
MKKNTKKIEPLAWVDLEMTGLSLEKDVILEVAMIVTDGQLNPISESLHIVINQPVSVLESMDEWCKNQHQRSGLTKEVTESSYTIKMADTFFAECIAQYAPKRGALLAGNSIWQDRLFIQKYMPQFYDYFHYKMVDVTSVQQLVKRWYTNDPRVEFKKQDVHRALVDIQESIAELKHYKTMFWIA